MHDRVLEYLVKISRYVIKVAFAVFFIERIFDEYRRPDMVSDHRHDRRNYGRLAFLLHVVSGMNAVSVRSDELIHRRKFAGDGEMVIHRHGLK